MVAIVLTFASCKKEKIHDDISHNELELSVYGEDDAVELNFYEPHMEVSGRLTPDFEGSEIVLKVITGEYPDGYEITASVSDEKTYESGDYIYHYKSYATDFKIANHTDDATDCIKILPEDTQVEVIVGDNLLTGTFPINNNEVVMHTYWDINSSTFFLYGYQFSSPETKTIEAWTTRDDIPVTFTLEWSDPTQYAALQPFDHYDVNISYWDGWSSQDDLTLGIYYDDTDTIFFKYDNKTYYSVHDQTTFMPLVEY